MITSRRNETIKAIRRLRRRQGDAAILEGAHLVGEALAAALPIESVLVTPEFAGSAVGRALLADLDRLPLEVGADVLDSLADADSPRGVLALASLPRSGIASIPLQRDGLLLYLDGLQDPGNLGAIARVAEAFGVRALLLAPGTVHPNHPRALRASAGSLLRLTVAIAVTAEEAANHLASVSPHWAALEAHGGDPLPDRAPSGCWVLALGAERGRIADEVMRRVECRWTIPLAPPVESLNVAVAAGIVLHALARRRSSP
jgi:TrmH family RNA methyltransferase